MNHQLRKRTASQIDRDQILVLVLAAYTPGPRSNTPGSNPDWQNNHKKKVIVCYYQQHLIDTDIIRVQTLHTIPTVKSNIWFHLSFPLQNALNNWWDSIGRPSIRCYFSSYNWGQWTKTNRSNENIMGKYRKRKVYIPFPFYVGRNIEFWSNTTTKHIS